MAAIHLQTLPDREEQLHLMQEDARYDVADDGDKDHTCIPDPSVFTDIASRPAPPKIPKVFVSNDCTFNCAYCGCRCSNERCHRYSHEPREKMCIRDRITSPTANTATKMSSSTARRAICFTLSLIHILFCTPRKNPTVCIWLTPLRSAISGSATSSAGPFYQTAGNGPSGNMPIADGSKATLDGSRILISTSGRAIRRNSPPIRLQKDTLPLSDTPLSFSRMLSPLFRRRIDCY